MGEKFTSSDITNFFLSDATEHLQVINDTLLDLEQNQEDLTLVDKIFRAIHAIKGSAGMAGFYVVSQLAHRIEDLLGKLREHELTVSADVVDLLFQGVDTLSHQVDNIANGQPEEESSLRMVVDLYAEVLGTSELPPSGAKPQPKAAATPAAAPSQKNQAATAAKPSKPTATTPAKPAPAPASPKPAAKPAPAQSTPAKQTPPKAAPGPEPPKKATPPASTPKKPQISESEMAEQRVKDNQLDQAVVLYRTILKKEPANKTIRQRLEETLALQLYLKEHPLVQNN